MRFWLFWLLASAYILRYELQIIRPVYDPLERGFDPYIPFAAVYAILIWLNLQRNGLYRNIAGRAWLEEVYLITSSGGRLHCHRLGDVLHLAAFGDQPPDADLCGGADRLRGAPFRG